MAWTSLSNFVESKPAQTRAADSLYGEETAATRVWAADYIVRNRAMLDLMASL